MSFKASVNLAYNPNAVAITGGSITGITQIVAGPGSANAPSLAITATTGWFSGGGAVIGLSQNTVNTWFWDASGFLQAATDNTYDIGASGATRPRSIYTGTSLNSPLLNATPGNGGLMGLTSVNELLTIAAAATTDSTTTIPAGAIILGVSVRVTTVIPTAATFTVTAATGGNTFSTAAVTVAANSTDKGTAAGALYTAAGTKVRITPNLTPGAATGVVRLCIYYLAPTAPTS